MLKIILLIIYIATILAVIFIERNFHKNEKGTGGKET